MATLLLLISGVITDRVGGAGMAWVAGFAICYDQF